MTMIERTCSVDGCGKPRLARTWCGMHYGRWKRTGDPGPAEPMRTPKGSPRPKCATDGCRARARRNGLCEPCSAKTWRAGAAFCTIDGCDRRINARGLCGKHYQDVRNGRLDHPAAAEILFPFGCLVDGCKNRLYAKGLCNMHWGRAYTAGDPGEAEPRRTRYEPGQTCAIPACDRRARWAGYCGTHNKRFRRFGITPEELDALVRVQNGRCAICGTPDPGAQTSGEWCIDHDHVTGKIRGLLCSRCNTGIGMLRDDPDVIASAFEYVRRHRESPPAA